MDDVRGRVVVALGSVRLCSRREREREGRVDAETDGPLDLFGILR